MALYQLQEATLGDLDGQGYVFPSDDTRGSGFRGVFFAAPEASSDDVVDGLVNAAPVPFEGVVYRKTTEGRASVLADVHRATRLRHALRLDFEVVEES
ncbi:MAG: hypothetical protein ACK41D_07430 [Rubricoccaceae bacterium]